MNNYMTEHEAITAVMQDAKDFSPNVPPVVTLGIQMLHSNLKDIQEQLAASGNQSLAGDVADCTTMTLELFGQIEGWFTLMCEKEGKAQ